VKLLGETSDVEIITDFAPWIYKKDRNKFKEIFTSNHRPSILPLTQVLGPTTNTSYLENINTLIRISIIILLLILIMVILTMHSPPQVS